MNQKRLVSFSKRKGNSDDFPGNHVKNNVPSIIEKKSFIIFSILSEILIVILTLYIV
jgi:hypothetical protein